MMDAGMIFNNPPEYGGGREKGLARWLEAMELFEREERSPAADPLGPVGRPLAYGWLADLYLSARAAPAGQGARRRQHRLEVAARLLVRQRTGFAKISEMSRLRRALWLLAAMTVVAVLFTSQIYVAYRAQSLPISFRGMLALQIGHWYSWVLAGPFAWWCATRWPVRGSRKLANVWRHLALASAASVMVVTVYIAVYYALLNLPMTRDWFSALDRSRSLAANALYLFTAYLHFELIVYSAVVAVAHAVQSNDELEPGSASRCNSRRSWPRPGCRC